MTEVEKKITERLSVVENEVKKLRSALDDVMRKYREIDQAYGEMRGRVSGMYSKTEQMMHNLEIVDRKLGR